MAIIGCNSSYNVEFPVCIVSKPTNKRVRVVMVGGAVFAIHSHTQSIQ